MNTTDQHMTLQDIKECPEFKHLTDEQAQLVHDTMMEFCSILSSQYKNLSEYVQKDQDLDNFKHAA